MEAEQMGPVRVLQVSIAVLILFGSVWHVRVAGMADAPSAPSGNSSSWLSHNSALASVLEQPDNGPADNDDTDNDDTDNDDVDNDDVNADNDAEGDNGLDTDNDDADNDADNDGGDNDNDDDFDDNDNFDDIDFDFPTPAPSRPPGPACSTPGQDTTFTSRDEKVTLRVFASTSPPVRIEIVPVIDFLSAPLPPGNLVGLLSYEIRASQCDGNALGRLPAEANLSIRYDDIEATGLDESRFVIGHLDRPSATWAPVEKRANDPLTNYVSATISQPGFYMVWELR
jgi:hypothetical protein